MKYKLKNLFYTWHLGHCLYRDRLCASFRSVFSSNRIDLATSVLTLGFVVVMLNGLAVGASFMYANPSKVVRGEPTAQDLESVVRELRAISTKVREHEKQLIDKASRLNALLAGVAKLDNSPNRKLSKISVQSNAAIGGGDEEREIIYSPAEHRVLRRYDSPVEDNVLKMLDYQLESLRSLPIGYPVVGRVSSGYGMRRSPHSGRRQAHRGIDLSVARNTPVVASADGKVVKAGYKGAYGKIVIVDHGNGMETRYAHLSSTSVKSGDQVIRGQRIGLSGSTGRSTGPHLHYEVRVDGKSKNPLYFMQLASKIKRL